MRSRMIVVVGCVLWLFLLNAAPGAGSQAFSLRYDSWEDRQGNGVIDCSELVTFRVSLVGTGATAGGDRGRITVPFSTDGWNYLPGSFSLDPALSESCSFTIVSGNSLVDPSLILDYLCDPRAGNPGDGDYALTFLVSGRFFNTNSGALTIAARNQRSSPTVEVQDVLASPTDPTQPCPPPPTPDVKTTKSLASGSGNPGATLVYNLVASNIGNGDATSVKLTETVPALAVFQPASSSPGWSCTPNNNAGSTCVLAIGALAAGASTSRTFTVKLAATFPENPPSIDNAACSSSTPDDPVGNDCDSVSIPPGGNPDLHTAKSLASGSGNPGATLVYSLVVTNSGNRGAGSVQLAETVPALSTFLPGSSSPGWSCSPDNGAGSTCTVAIGTVAAGASVSRSFAVQLAATFPENPPSIDNSACSSTSTPGDPAGNNCGSVSTPPGGNPDLRTTKTLASGSGDPGATLIYNLVVGNSGNRGAGNVQLTETVPALATFFAGSSSPGWSCSPGNGAGSTCTMAIGTVAAGASVSRSFAVQLAATFPENPPPIDNTACSSTSTPGDPAGNNCGSVSTPPGGNPDLRTMKSLASGTGEPGATLVYNLVVGNSGNRGAGNVQLTESVPALSTFLPGSSSPGWSCSPGNGAGSTCTLAIGTVAAGASVSRMFAVQLAATFPENPPSIDNTACSSTSTPGDPAGNNCGSVSTPPGGHPDLRTEKTLASGSGDPGATLVYNLVVSNSGNRGAGSVQLAETVPALSTFLPGSSSPGWSCSPGNGAGSTCTMAIGTVAAGASVSRSFAVRLAATFPENPPSIDNTACSSTSTAGDPDGNDCDSTSTPPGGSSDLVLRKTLASGTVVANGVLVFILSLENLGNRDATGVVLHETVPADSTFEAAASSPGWSCSPDGSAGSACTLPVGSVAAGASSTHLFAVRLRSDLAPGTRVSNTACAEQAPGATDPDGNNCGTLIVDPPLPQERTDLELAIGVDENARRPGEPFLFTLTVRNASTVAAEGLRISVSLPSFGTEPTELDPACQNPGGVVIECSVAELPGGASRSFTWKQAAFQTGNYTVSAELMEARPDDIDSTPGNGLRTEDDFAEVAVVVTMVAGVHDIPTLTDVGVWLMAFLMVGLSMAAIKRGQPPFPSWMRKGR
jgi:uncharacterized repeat protein (TIGR01451 family)